MELRCTVGQRELFADVNYVVFLTTEAAAVFKSGTVEFIFVL